MVAAVKTSLLPSNGLAIDTVIEASVGLSLAAIVASAAAMSTAGPPVVKVAEK